MFSFANKKPQVQAKADKMKTAQSDSNTTGPQCYN